MANWFDFGLIEWIAVITTLLYNYFLTREKIICWLFGIVSSVAGCLLFAEKELWGQFVLYVFYAAMGVYGWWYWHSGSNNQRPVVKWQPKLQWLVFVSGVILSLLVWLVYVSFFEGTQNVLLDSCITVFSFIATFKESRKVLSGWIYWIVLNALSAWLFTSSQLYGLAVLSAVYFVLSVIGYKSWQKSFRVGLSN